MLTFDEFKKALIFTQPKLVFKEEDGLFMASGTYCLTQGPNPDGHIDEFEIVLGASPDYPAKEPLLYETGGRIPRDIDWHMYNSGRCCTCVWEEWLETTEDTSFGAFLNGPVRDFFISQAHFEHHKEWPFGERKHGFEGLVESVSRILGFRVTRADAVQHLNTLVGGKPKGHWRCVCGSGRRIRDCNPAHISDLRDRLGHENLVRLRDKMRNLSRSSR